LVNRLSEIQDHWRRWQRTLGRFTAVVVREPSKKQSKVSLGSPRARGRSGWLEELIAIAKK
jgi:nicotinic acid mononucleotide adenylyltransferase